MIGSTATPGTEYPERTIYTDHDVFYVPFVADDGRVGYRVGKSIKADDPERGHEAGQETFIYLNPSTSTTTGDGDVFLYVGIENDPAEDESFVFVPMDDQSFGVSR